MFFEKCLLAVIGLASGGIVSAGVFAFLTALGLLQRLADRTGTATRVRLYEDCIIAGGTLGNLVFLHDFSLPGGDIVAGFIGILYGIFIGCLIMSLAETLDAVPIFCRRIRLAMGMSFIIWSLAIGKGFGSVLYFVWEM